MAWSSCLPLEKQPNRDRWEEEQRRAGAFRVERAAALFWEGNRELVNSVRSFSAVAAQTSHSGLLLLKKLTYTEQHLGLSLAQEEESNNNLYIDSRQTRGSLWSVLEQLV